MKIILAAVSQRGTRSKSEATDRLLADYVERAGRYIPCESSLYTVVMLTSHNLVQCESNAIDHHGSQTGEDLLMWYRRGSFVLCSREAPETNSRLGQSDRDR